MKAGPWWVAGAILAYLIYNRRQVGSLAQTGVEDVTAALTGWQSVGAGATWVPELNQAEDRYGIPANLLARLAYQESHFRPEIIDGSMASPVGALGLMQMLPKYFTTVNRPRPYSTQDTLDQIDEGAQELVRLFSHFQDWTLVLAAYNDGQGNVDQYLAGARTLPAETQTYVADITGDIPAVTGALA